MTIWCLRLFEEQLKHFSLRERHRGATKTSRGSFTTASALYVQIIYAMMQHLFPRWKYDQFDLTLNIISF